MSHDHQVVLALDDTERAWLDRVRWPDESDRDAIVRILKREALFGQSAKRQTEAAPPQKG